MSEPKVHNYSTYTNGGCRCDKCRADFAKWQFGARRRRVLAENDPRHGTNNAYSNYMCRCEPCRVAHAEADNRKRKDIRI